LLLNKGYQDNATKRVPPAINVAREDSKGSGTDPQNNG